jgi:hypothetical protein
LPLLVPEFKQDHDPHVPLMTVLNRNRDPK